MLSQIGSALSKDFQLPELPNNAENERAREIELEN
jgi:hypothetical protein